MPVAGGGAAVAGAAGTSTKAAVATAAGTGTKAAVAAAAGTGTKAAVAAAAPSWVIANIQIVAVVGGVVGGCTMVSVAVALSVILTAPETPYNGTDVNATLMPLAPPTEAFKLTTIQPPTTIGNLIVGSTESEMADLATLGKEVTETQTTTPPGTTAVPAPESYNYTEVLHKSILFYEAQRSGKLPENNRIYYRGDSALNDSGRRGEDLSGGYYDAGDHIKSLLPMAWSLSVLTWGFIEFRQAYEAAHEVNYMLDLIKWGADFIVKSHTQRYELYTQIADKDLDHQYWGRPEDMTMPRPAYAINATIPGSDTAGAASAALTAASVAFLDYDPNYSELLLNESKVLFEFGDKYRGYYRECIPPGKGIYIEGRNYHDELGWAAVWLYKATGDEFYLNKTLEFYALMSQGRSYSFGWGSSDHGVHMLLYNLTGETKYANRVTKFVNEWLPGGKLPHTPKGLVFRNDWGSLRYAGATSFLALVAAKHNLNVDSYLEFAKFQIHYSLGSTGRSYVVGFGENPPVRPHHRSSSCPLPPEPCSFVAFRSEEPNPHILYGALVGGPDIEDHYVDDRKDYFHNEVTLDYNAGFQSAIAGLLYFELKDQLP